MIWFDVCELCTLLLRCDHRQEAEKVLKPEDGTPTFHFFKVSGISPRARASRSARLAALRSASVSCKCPNAAMTCHCAPAKKSTLPVAAEACKPTAASIGRGRIATDGSFMVLLDDVMTGVAHLQTLSACVRWHPAKFCRSGEPQEVPVAA